MKKILLIALMCFLLAGCGGVPEVSRTYPVKNHMTVKSGVCATYMVNGREEVYFFDEWLVYPCEEDSIVAALFWEHLPEEPESANEIYLYLNEKEYEEYRKQKADYEKGATDESQ